MNPSVAFDAIVFFAMIFITVAVALRAAWVFGAGNVRQRHGWLAAFAAVMGLTATLALIGVFARTDLRPPALQTMFVLMMIALFSFGSSQRGRQAVRRAALPALILLQAFRLPLEVLMLRAALLGIMPREFSLLGYNFDIVTGATALVLGLLLSSGRKVPRWALQAWNAWGIACLAVIAALAVATSPNVAAFGGEPAHVSLWVLQLPYVWLPFILVSIAVIAHGAVSAKLWQTRSR